MNQTSHLESASSGAMATPLLRTVLLCDIVDSTSMVERLGDQRVATLMKRHDALLRQLVVFCHGQLIDRADGALAVFERPIQALDFALRYQRGLHDLGADEGLDLKARVGMHVGDVVMWANEPRDVLGGAKAFEVEGLAKPVAARLMGLALPGQILMSGMAQNLCQRAAGELGDDAPKLRWLMHGRYRFKGVPAPMLVHEVGQPGVSPLRAPESNAKAWRELPLWRRPPVLALELLAVGALAAAGVATMLRSPPAIAFAERDWVVVADLQNRTEEPLFDDALDTALLVGLAQSRHVNVVSQLQVDRALERMQRQGQPVDRQLATELALREGARAVILPTVAQVGGLTRVSLEVIDPQSGVTVYSESADADDTAAVLAALDETADRVRGRLGEALGSVQAASRPLALVTTDDLEALRALSLAERKTAEARYDEARALLEEAVRRDPEFAMAWLRLAFLSYVESDSAKTRELLDKALAHRERLTQREAIFLDAAEATLTDPQKALDRLKLLGTLYPDEYRAHYNYAWFSHYDLLRSGPALDVLQGALVQRNSRQGMARYMEGVILLALNRYAEAADSFDRAELLGIRGYKREAIEVFAAQRRYGDAARAQARQTTTGSSSVDLEMRLFEVTLPLDQGRHTDALAAARRLEADAAAAGVSDLVRWNQEAVTLLVRSYAPDAALAADLRAFVRERTPQYRDAGSLARRHLTFQLLAAGWMAARDGDVATAEAVRDLLANEPMVAAYPANASMLRILDAEAELARGKPGDAVARLDASVAAGSGLYLERAVLARARLVGGDTASARRHAEWLAANRGRAYAEASSLGLLQPANVVESTLALRMLATVLDEQGDADAARNRLREFEQAWPDADARAAFRRR